MNQLLLVGAGGAAGSICRYLVGLWTLKALGDSFPWGTFMVNVIGSVAVGFLAELVARRFGASPEMRLLLITGFLGGFTTFSAFSLEAVSFFEGGALVAGAGYVMFTIIISLAAVSGGVALGRALL